MLTLIAAFTLRNRRGLQRRMLIAWCGLVASGAVTYGEATQAAVSSAEQAVPRVAWRSGLHRSVSAQTLSEV